MLKKIGLTIILMALTACNQILPSTTREQQSSRFWYTPFQSTDLDQNTLYTSKNAFKVAMLLPLSGKASTYGKGLQNAAMMALEDTNNPNMQVRFYDTKSSSEGASNAFSDALNNDAQIVFGPLMSEEVSAISYHAKSKGIPVISFSTSANVLGNGIYTLGLLTDEQIKRIVSYIAKQNRSKIAMVVPDSPVGLNLAKTAVQTAANNGISVTKIGFYEPSTLEFSDLVQKMIENQNFDTVLIAETGNRLKAISATFGYFDIAYPDVLFAGTSIWENTNLSKETTLYKAVYPTISRVHNEYFEKKYKDLFGETPNSLYAYDYDGIALASALSRQNTNNLYSAIENPDGYIGINGSFRLFKDGTNEHNLDIAQVTPNGTKTINTASKTFLNKQDEINNAVLTKPEIYGKDEQTVYQHLFATPRIQSYFNVF